MKNIPKPRSLNAAGFTLTELAVVMGIISILSGFAAVSAGQMIGRYNTESRIRMMHADLLQARVEAMLKNRQHFFVVKSGTPATYQLYEDTNDSGGSAPDNGDTAVWQSPKPLEYAPSWNGTIILDPRGIVKTDTLSLTNNLTISFNVAPTEPEYDCLQVNAMRITLGKTSGSGCAAR